ncbi:unnamed protein product [Microthlaspi erraticum]|uniref:beta-ketoacyl-[acyl-carrier-protein] synthase I n=1 Tax=Microthlaspi erraticum TaxID=1685480 RepID=A0A6D2KM09_9BRAS|nr:unnamed protein product [Microthlaspi erraticum]CAA7052937.1 unnamed protein product [Microthlaspi erraticum]
MTMMVMMRDSSTMGAVGFDRVSKVVLMQDFASDNIFLFELVPSPDRHTLFFSGEIGINLIDRFDASKFPTRFGGQIRGFSSKGYIDGKNECRLHDCLKYCIVAGKKALEIANLRGDKLHTVHFHSSLS